MFILELAQGSKPDPYTHTSLPPEEWLVESYKLVSERHMADQAQCPDSCLMVFTPQGDCEDEEVGHMEIKSSASMRTCARYPEPMFKTPGIGMCACLPSAGRSQCLLGRPTW